MKLSDFNKLKAYALRLLARREQSQRELKQKLAHKTTMAGEVEAVMAALLAENWVSDRRFAESYTRSRLQKGYGYRYIYEGLLTHGIDKDLIDNVLYQDEATWRQQIINVWQKRFRGKLPSDPRERSQQIRFLQQRGFSMTEINGLWRYHAAPELDDA